MPEHADTVRLDLEAVKPLAMEALQRAGADEANAEAVAENMARAERDGASSHGLFRLPKHMECLRNGKVNGRAEPRIEAIAPSVLRVDCDGGYAQLGLRKVADPLAELAKRQGIAAAALVNHYHFAALWPETEMMAECGLVALACTAYKPVVAPAGGTKPFFGTDPLSFAWPRPGKDPMVFDQASSVMARGEVQIAAREGRALPDNVGIGPDGRPTNDPAAVLKGAMLTFGGYKGAAIALMIELLVGPLIGERTSPEAGRAEPDDEGPARGGEFLLAMDPARFGNPEGWSERAEALFAEMLEQEGVRLPGDGRRARRERVRREGIALPRALYEAIAAHR